MRLVVVKDGLPKRENFKLIAMFEEFMKLNVKVVKVDLDEGDYASIYVASKTFRVSCERKGYPINISIRNKEIYMIRTDM